MANDISAILQALQPTSTTGTDLFTLSPKTRQRHLFQAMLPAGLGLIAASAPSTDPGAFGKGLGKAGQDLFTNMNTLGQRAMQRKILNYNMQRQAAAAELAKVKADRDAKLFPYQLSKLRAEGEEAERKAKARENFMRMFGPQSSQAAINGTTPPSKLSQFLGFNPTQSQTAQLMASMGEPEKIAVALKNIEDQRASQLNTEVKNYETQTKSLRSVLNSANEIGQLDRRTGDPVSQIEILYRYIRAMDPSSAVKEGEIALAQSVQNVQQQMENWYSRWKPGEGGAQVTAEKQIKKMLARIKEIGEMAGNRLQRKEFIFEKRLNNFGVDPRLVFDRVKIPTSGEPQPQPRVTSTLRKN